jgi:hypothetical protein
MKRKKKTPLQKAKEKLWELCKEVVRKRDGNICTSCGAIGLVGSNWHTGHFIPSSICGAYLRYYIRNLHSQCYNCNIHLGGNGVFFNKEIVSKYGQKFVDKLIEDRNTMSCMKADLLFYQSKIEEYEQYRTMTKKKLKEITNV